MVYVESHYLDYNKEYLKKRAKTETWIGHRAITDLNKPQYREIKCAAKGWKGKQKCPYAK